MSVLVFFDRYVAFVALPFVPIYVFAVAMISKTVHPMFHDMRDQLDKGTDILSENVQGVQVIRAFAREDDERRRYEQANRGIYEQWLRLARTFSTYFPSIFFLGSLNLVAMLAMTSYRALEGVLEAGLIWSVFRWSQVLTNNGQRVARMIPTLEHSLVSAERVFEILDAPSAIVPPGKPHPMPEGHGHVVFENVTFCYGDEPILRDLTLDIPPGTNVALVGATGSGKSTLIKLLPRFYDPQQGRILIDGVDIRELDLQELRNEIGFVFQDTFLFSTSLAGNIAYGVPEAERKAIEDAARRARVDEFVEAFEQGYDTMVGERGITLSGGQRQRVAIARALLVDPRILILDDATASVDSTTERAIQEALAEVMKRRTTFIIAHRASTVKRADLILVLDDGRVVQQGRHEELIAVEGPYREFCELQWQLGLDVPESSP
jgi:ATP-binding cassette subfamily B protein